MHNAPTDKDKLDEIASLVQGKPHSMADAINASGDGESFYYNEAGFIFRILRGPSTGKETCAIVEIMSLDGEMVNKGFKGLEATALFAVKYPDELTRSPFHLLAGRPSFIPARNTSYRSEMDIDHALTVKAKPYTPVAG